MNILDIKKLLKDRNITYEELSNSSKIPTNTLKNIFRGKTKNPRIDTMNSIYKALEIENYAKKPLPTIKPENIETELLKLFRLLDSKTQMNFLELIKNLVETPASQNKHEGDNDYN